MVLLYTMNVGTVDEGSVRDRFGALTTALRARSDVASVLSYADSADASLVSFDRRSTYVLLTLKSRDSSTQDEQARDIAKLAAVDGAKLRLGGPVPTRLETVRSIKSDIIRAEIITLPVLFVFLLLVFRSLVAACVPIVAGGLAILTGFIAIRLLAMFTEMSTYSVHAVTLVGLGLSADYGLLMVSRFREELAQGNSSHVSAIKTVETAGRTVIVSGLSVSAVSTAGFAFPHPFMHSMVSGMVAAVLMTTLVCITVVPALLAVLGTRINAMRVGLVRGGGRGHARWGWLAKAVMRRPIVFSIAAGALLALCASPAVHIELGQRDIRALPSSSQARIVHDQMVADFPQSGTGRVSVLVRSATQQASTDIIAQLGRVKNVSAVWVAAQAPGMMLLGVSVPGGLAAAELRRVVTDIRRLSPLAQGARLEVGGEPAEELDSFTAVRSRLVTAILVVAGAMLIMLTVAFGSIVVAIKAVLLNIASTSAAIGVLVWSFQDGNLADVLGFTTPGHIETLTIIMIILLVLGFATDYEIFMLSRVHERWLLTGDNTHSVAAGLQASGPVITAAALLLVAVSAGFTTASGIYQKMMAFGIGVSIVIDAAVVRALLLPATMRLLGELNWWRPFRTHHRYRASVVGVHSESADPDLPHGTWSREPCPSPQRSTHA